MRRCLQLAQNGLGRTYPNPLVGCVIVHNDKIIGEGWHQKAGSAHAEVNAIRSVKDESKLKQATLYVNLEPCSHYGKTPPCSDLIIAKGIKKVVIANTDPNPKVAGRGVMKLMESGTQVYIGLLEEEGNHLNRRFFTYHTQKRPYIILKWAQSQDGFIAPENQEEGKPVWISNSHSKQLVHKWRSEEQGILIGKNTAIQDNPQLSTRLWTGKNPTRILIDRNLNSLETNPNLHLFDGQIETIVFCEKEHEGSENLIFEKISFGEDFLEQILYKLGEHNLQSIIVEGGRVTLQSFIDAGLWDEARVFTGTPLLHSGIKAPTFNFEPKEEFNLGSNQIRFYRK